MLKCSSKSKTTFKDKLVFFLPLIVIAGVITSKFKSVNGYWGHDYYYSLTRLFIGSVHFWQSPFSLPHYTPSLCGGIPFFADPQNPYFSIPQGLSFFVDPLLATHLTYFLAYSVGYMGMLRLLERVFYFEKTLARLGALLFILNGFLYENFFVGHLTHHSYVLFPWILIRLRDAPSPKFGVQFSRVFQLTLMVCYLIYSGGFHMFVSLLMMLFVLFPFLLRHHFDSKTLRAWIKNLLISTALVLLICSGKLTATALYSKIFFVNPLHVSRFNFFDLITKYFWFWPGSMADMRRFGNMYLGPWEYVGFVSKITIPLLLVGVFYFFKQQPFRKLISLIPAICVLFWACGIGANSSIPLLNLYHNPIKLLGVFIIPIIIVSVYGASKIELRFLSRLPIWKYRKRFFSLVILLLTVEFSYYAEYFRSHPYISNYTYFHEPYSRLKTRGLEPVTKVINEHDWDISGLALGCTSLKCYEPLFGYKYEGLKTKLIPGDTKLIRHGTYNLSHPGCLLYPEFFHCSPWDRIPASESTHFAKFIQGKDAWGIPFWHSLIYWTNLLCFLSLVALRLGLFFSKTLTDKKYFPTVFARTVRS